MKLPLAIALGVLLAASPASRAAEPWADPGLPITDGLQLWFDATRIAAAAEAPRAAARGNGDSLAAWYDASGHRRHLAQSEPSFRPTLRADLLRGGSPPVVRFGGTDDFLVASGLNLGFDKITLVVLTSPRSNPGLFRGLVEFNESGKNDYVTGLNVDLGSQGGERWEHTNVEGLGFGGETNLMSQPRELGTFHTLAVASASGGDVRLYVDGRLEGRRPRAAGTLRMDELRIAARCYDNSGRPAVPTGFFDGDVAEVLVYNRELSDIELADLDRYLHAKYAPLFELKGLQPEPIVRVLAPGFTVRELPVELTNINDLLYMPNGRLLALGYDGRIHRLSDSDGDGLEDRVEPYWYEPTLRVPLGMALAREGLYVTSNGKVSLFVDEDGDARADGEQVVSSGWVPPLVSTNGVDAMGLALDNDANLFFGIGCADYTNAYQVRDGRAHYDIASERGTIVRLSPDRKRREIHVTGIRFPVALAFNRAGDLFCTDQEGATWLPGGNPLDELNHILPGRHYGFPPRHADYLPDVVDEPPLVAYGPQHQSTCGLVFNEATAGRKSFGPAAWEGDALVAGYSRGKLWRSTLAKTPAGYVGRSILIATSRMLLLDTAVAPDGSLVVACHSGPPDWGSGPLGVGKLFKITYSGAAAPQPVAAWPAGPLEVRVAFDRPVAPSLVEGWQKAEIEYGDFVRPGDRFEVLHPPYAVVQQQLQTPRHKLRTAAARLADGGRTLVLTTDPHSLRTQYALSLPGVGSGESETHGPAIDLAYDLTGVEAAWHSADGKQAWSGWLPHLELAVARQFTRGSAEHAAFEKLVQKPGRLSLHARVQLTPGASLRLVSNVPTEGRWGAAAGSTTGGTIELADDAGAAALTVELQTGKSAQTPELTVSFHTLADPTERPLPTAALLLPWAPERVPEPLAAPSPPPELAGGDWTRGKELFFGQAAKCGTCHTVRGQGGKIGPDLSNLVYRDAGSVLRDIVEPNAMINPDYVSYTLLVADGRVLTGLVRAEGADRVRLFDVASKETLIPTDEIEELHANPLSLMPGGISDQLRADQIKDLLAFLLAAEPQPDVPPTEMPGAPPPRRRAEVLAALAATPADELPPEKPKPLKIVLVAGPKDHGPGEHDYPRWQRTWSELLAKSPGVQVRTAYRWPEESLWASADLVVLFHMDQDYSDERLAELDAFLARGGGLVLLHSAVIPAKEPEKLAARIGLAWQWNTTKFRHGELDLSLPLPDHPITRGLKTMHFKDESYWPLVGDAEQIELLGTTVEEGQPRAMLWTYEPGKKTGGQGRVFVSILGHYSWTFDDPLFRILLLRGMAWAAREPVGRFHALVTEGVRLAD